MIGAATIQMMSAAQRLALEWRRPIHRREYERMVEAAVFEEARVELLYGVIVEMSPHGPSHDAPLTRLAKLLTLAVADRADVRVQCSFAASDGSEPEPDIAVVPVGRYDASHPDEALLIVEVAVSSLERDRTAKAQLYAECGVPDYWIVNVVDGLVEVHTDIVRGAYSRITSHDVSETIAPRAFPDTSVRVADVLA
jgi:Uma2 family endonuclease